MRAQLVQVRKTVLSGSYLFLIFLWCPFQKEAACFAGGLLQLFLVEDEVPLKIFAFFSITKDFSIQGYCNRSARAGMVSVHMRIRIVASAPTNSRFDLSLGTDIRAAHAQPARERSAVPPTDDRRHYVTGASFTARTKKSHEICLASDFRKWNLFQTLCLEVYNRTRLDMTQNPKVGGSNPCASKLFYIFSNFTLGWDFSKFLEKRTSYDNTDHKKLWISSVRRSFVE